MIKRDVKRDIEGDFKIRITKKSPTLLKENELEEKKIEKGGATRVF